MKNNREEMNEFSWKLLLIVTGISSFIFNGVLVLLDGNSSTLFKWIGISGTSIGLLIYIVDKLLKPARK